MEMIMTHCFTPTSLATLEIPSGPLAGLLIAARDRLAASAAERGVHIAISTDFDELLEVNLRETSAGTWYPMLPASDPRFRRLVPTNSFWLRGCGPAGEVVSVQAAVLEEDEGSIGQRLIDLSAFYGDRATYAPTGEWCSCLSPTALSTTGRSVFSQGGWTHPDYRGLRLFPLFHRVARLVSWVRWEPDVLWGVIQANAVDAWKESHMGPRHLDEVPTITYQRAAGRHELRFLRFTPAQMLGDLAVVASATGRAAA